MLMIFLTNLSFLHILNCYGWITSTYNFHQPSLVSYLINKAGSYSRVKWSILRANHWSVSSVKVRKAGNVTYISFMFLQDTMLRTEAKFNFTSSPEKLCFCLEGGDFFSASQTVCRSNNWRGSNVNNDVLLSSYTTLIHTSQ